MNPDSTLAVTNTCPKDGVHLLVQHTTTVGPLGDIPPAEFEAQYYEQAAVA